MGGHRESLGEDDYVTTDTKIGATYLHGQEPQCSMVATRGKMRWRPSEGSNTAGILVLDTQTLKIWRISLIVLSHQVQGYRSQGNW